MIRVMIVDDDALMREGLRWILRQQSDLEVVAEAVDGDDCMRQLKTEEVDVVVLDIMMPRAGGIEVLRRLRSQHANLRVLALSSHNDRQWVLTALRNGASGYLLKDAAGDELVEAVRRVAVGGRYLGAGITDVVVDAFLEGDSEVSDGLRLLGDRECQVLQRLAEGQTSRDIASDLHLAVSTVDTHRRNIMRKLDCHNVAELTKYAIKHGLTSA